MISETVDWTPDDRRLRPGQHQRGLQLHPDGLPGRGRLDDDLEHPHPDPELQQQLHHRQRALRLRPRQDDRRPAPGHLVAGENYNPQIAAGGQPYGASFLEESATAGLKHKFSDRLIGEGKAGYLRRTDATTGGFTNYRGPWSTRPHLFSLIRATCPAAAAAARPPGRDRDERNRPAPSGGNHGGAAGPGGGEAFAVGSLPPVRRRRRERPGAGRAAGPARG